MPSEFSKTIAENIRRLRHEKQLTQQELSSKAGFSLNYISQVARNVIDPTLTALGKISKVLGVDPQELIKS